MTADPPISFLLHCPFVMTALSEEGGGVSALTVCAMLEHNIGPCLSLILEICTSTYIVLI